MRIRFHWRLAQGGERAAASRALGSSAKAAGLPDLGSQVAFCRAAQEAGIDGLLLDIGAAKPDPVLLSAALGLATDKVGFIIAVRSGLLAPATFTQQINTLSALIGGDRLLLNVVAGHSPAELRCYGDFLGHDERYARTEEFLAICNRFWRGEEPIDFEGRYFRVEGGRLNTPFVADGRSAPLIYVAGGSDVCRELSIRQGSCWMRLADTPEKVRRSARAVVRAGKQIGVRMSVFVAPTRQRAIAGARALAAEVDPRRQEKQLENSFVSRSDSVSMRASYAMAEREWLTPTLWTGLVRTHGAPTMSLVGDPAAVADALMQYKRAGVAHFILSGWPKLEQMRYFGQEVIPRVREMEGAAGLAADGP